MQIYAVLGQKAFYYANTSIVIKSIWVASKHSVVLAVSVFPIYRYVNCHFEPYFLSAVFAHESLFYSFGSNMVTNQIWKPESCATVHNLSLT